MPPRSRAVHARDQRLGIGVHAVRSFATRAGFGLRFARVIVAACAMRKDHRRAETPGRAGEDYYANGFSVSSRFMHLQANPAIRISTRWQFRPVEPQPRRRAAPLYPRESRTDPIFGWSKWVFPIFLINLKAPARAAYSPRACHDLATGITASIWHALAALQMSRQTFFSARRGAEVHLARVGFGRLADRSRPRPRCA